MEGWALEEGPLMPFQCPSNALTSNPPLPMLPLPIPPPPSNAPPSNAASLEGAAVAGIDAASLAAELHLVSRFKGQLSTDFRKAVDS